MIVRRALFEVSGTTAFAFGRGGANSQCGKAGEGQLPPTLGEAWWQQARFGSRRAPSLWAGSVKVGPNNLGLTPAQLDSWAGGIWDN